MGSICGGGLGQQQIALAQVLDSSDILDQIDVDDVGDIVRTQEKMRTI
jgi:hypothetical protein